MGRPSLRRRQMDDRSHRDRRSLFCRQSLPSQPTAACRRTHPNSGGRTSLTRPDASHEELLGRGLSLESAGIFRQTRRSHYALFLVLHERFFPRPLLARRPREYGILSVRSLFCGPTPQKTVGRLGLYRRPSFRQPLCIRPYAAGRTFSLAFRRVASDGICRRGLNLLAGRER